MYEVDKYTVSLLHLDDGIKDETGKVWTANGGAKVSTAQSKLGGSSLYLNGSDQYLTTSNSTDFDFGSGDFTIDWWEYRTGNTNDNQIAFTSSISKYGLAVGYTHSSTDGKITWWLSSNGTSWDIALKRTMGDAIYNEWAHYALVRKSGVFYAFQNGILKDSLNSSLSIAYHSDTNPSIGRFGGEQFNGYIDELRISKGIARWTKDFDPTASVTAPTNLTATAGNSQVTLSWTAVEGATSYVVKRSTTAGGEYITIANGVTDASYIDKSVTNGTTYYYVVAAVKGDLVSSNSNEASATPVGDGKALLCVTMIDSSEREYQLSTAEIDAFINWFSRTVGTGTTCYVLNKNVGVHNSKEYLAFEKIISFEVTDL